MAPVMQQPFTAAILHHLSGGQDITDRTSGEMVVPGSLSWVTPPALETQPCSLPPIVAFLVTLSIT